LEDFLMSDAVKVGFVPFSASPRGIVVVFCDDTLMLGAATLRALGKAADTVKRAAAVNQFKGKSGSALDILAPEGIRAERLIVVGAGKPSALKEKDFLKFGGVAAGKLNGGSRAVSVIAELPGGAMSPGQATAIGRRRAAAYEPAFEKPAAPGAVRLACAVFDAHAVTRCQRGGAEHLECRIRGVERRDDAAAGACLTGIDAARTTRQRANERGSCCKPRHGVHGGMLSPPLRLANALAVRQPAIEVARGTIRLVG